MMVRSCKTCGGQAGMSQMYLFEGMLAKAKLPTNLSTNRHPIHRWFNITAGFSPEFVTECIREAALKPNDILIDPFAGLSTSLVQANIEKVCSVGFEAHPFFHDLSIPKLFPPTQVQTVDKLKAVLAQVKAYDGDLSEIWSEDAQTFLEKLVPEKSLRLMSSALQLEGTLSASQRGLYRLILSRVLESASGSQTDGIYKAPTTLKKSTPYLEAVDAVISEIREDIAITSHSYATNAVLHHASSTNMSAVASESCSLCVTSPPYLNNFDFAEMTRMELYFWRYARSWREITEKVRRQLIVNTTTAPSDLKHNQGEFGNLLSPDFRGRLDSIIHSLKRQRDVKPGKKDYYLLVYPYFAQLLRVFRELRRTLKPGSSLHLLVADAALYGVHIETHLLLADLMRETGFDVQSINTLRTRGTRWILEKRQGAAGGLGEFHIHARRL